MEDSQTNPQTPLPPEPSPNNHPCCSLPNCRCNTLLYCLAAFLILIILSGVVYLYRSQKAINKQQPAIATITPTPSPNPTSNWQTYTNQKVTFEYPNDWKMLPIQTFGSRNETGFDYNNTTLFTFSNIANYNQITGKPYISLDEYLNTRKPIATDIQISGREAKIIFQTSSNEHTISYMEAVLFSPNSDSLISFYFSWPYFTQEKTTANAIFDQILSTFRFIDQPTPTTGFFSNQDYSIKYPLNYFIKTDSNILKISNSQLFENEEKALVITVKKIQQPDSTITPTNDQINILDKLGYNYLVNQFGKKLSAYFEGDPPWGYYNFFINYPTSNSSTIHINVRVHGSDEMDVPGGSNGQLANNANQILSTFKFLDQPTPIPEGQFCGGIAANLPENQCPTGYYCFLSNNDPDASGKCLKTSSSANPQFLCESSAGGKWLPDYNECEGVESRTCSQLLSGNYYECASPCRHDPDYPLVYCAQVCVPVCTLK